jgi:hypothetical protein
VSVLWQEGWKSGGPLSDITNITQDRSLDLSVEGNSDWSHQIFDKSVELLVDGDVVDSADCLPATSACWSRA